MGSGLVLAILAPALCLGAITVKDPSDVILPSDWAADNAIIEDYSPIPEAQQPSDLLANYTFEGGVISYNHTSFSVNANDTSVIVAANGTDLSLSYVDILKEGYFSNLIHASFWGFNAALNVANKSRAALDHVNITVHNGAANVYAYGTDTVVTVDNSWLYSSGPVSHALYASGNATIIGHNLQVYAGGRRSSSFSGDSPAGYIEVYDSISHVVGIGSATYYALGTIYGENVLSVSENGPVAFSDGPQHIELVNCDAKAGLLGGVAMFSSQGRQSGAVLNLTSTKFTTTREEVPGLWFGNLIVDVYLTDFEISLLSDVLLVANFSQITQDFNFYGGYAEAPNLQPAIVTATVAESQLSGDLVAYNGSSISWSLTEHSSWTGKAYSGFGDATFAINLDKTSTWSLTADTTVTNFTNADRTLSNIQSNGFDIYYVADSEANYWLDGTSIDLPGGGSVKPA
ncbi:hypothetical protein B0O99DRAFT_509925 [Bisporella sp. PMI_857]|nr:hypothetical protein B0O99DRAFT_509925 [Bisporella sp. PMI_857]